jgi:succinyl-diaminopimelate desuccinylase
MTLDVLDLARDLIRKPSVTPADEGAMDVLHRALEGLGFTCRRMKFGEIENLYARRGTARPNLCFAGHTDVVPVGDAAAWTSSPFAADINSDDILIGRGAVDMKGSIAAFVAAVAQVGETAGSLSFLITGDEEGVALDGTRKVVEALQAEGEIIDHCIVGEPSSAERLGDMIKIGRRGSLSGAITVSGKQGHVGYPHLADNPVHHIVRLVTALKATPLDAGTAHFDASNLEVTSIDTGNPAVNVIPAAARAQFNIRFNDLWTPQTLADEIRARLERAANGARYEVTFQPTNALAFLTKPGPFVETLAGAIEAETGRRPVLSTTGGTSDARFICRYAEVLEFGLVGQTMHAIDERTAIDDLHKLSAIFGRVIETYFAR